MELKKVLFIGFVWPEAKSSAAGSRMMQLVELFIALGAKVTFASAAKPGEHPSNLKELGVDSVPIELNHSSFDDFIKILNPDLVVFDRYMSEEQFGWRVADHCPDCVRVLDTEDLHSLRYVRQQCLKDGVQLTDKLLLESPLTKRELASIFRSDLSLMISEYEIQLLEGLFKVPSTLLCYLPLTVDAVANSKAEWEVKKDFVFIGNFIHAPNWDAVLNLKHTIWPRIHKNLPGVKLHVYGAYASDKVYQLHNEQDGFLVHGWVEDAQEVFESARVCLVPLRYGAGIKGKIIDAMNFGTPNVTTSIGAEGIHGNMAWGGFIEDDHELFAKAAIELYTDKVVWEQSLQNGYALLNERFDKEDHFNAFRNALQTYLREVKNNRNKNFVGAMLMQHTVSASKYMAKWIEAKNKNNP